VVVVIVVVVVLVGHLPHPCRYAPPPSHQEHPNTFSITGSKGLEFDDVLIYNFFTNSDVPAKVWRALSQYKDEEAEPSVSIPHDFDTFQSMLKQRNGRHIIHPTEFSATEHRALENELKDLYIAITRAKGNVWFFDEETVGDNSVDSFNASTMYQLFERRGLVNMYGKESEAMSFTNSSTPAEWAKNAYETMMRSRSARKGEEDIQIEKLRSAALAYHKGECPNEAHRCDGYAAQMSASHLVGLTPAKKQVRRT